MLQRLEMKMRAGAGLELVGAATAGKSPAVAESRELRREDPRDALREQAARPAVAAGYLSRIIVTGPSLTSVTLIIALKEPVSTGPTLAARSLS